MIKSPLFFALLAYTILFTFSCKVYQIELKQTQINDNSIMTKNKEILKLLSDYKKMKK